MSPRVIVDEGAGPGTPVWEAFSRLQPLGDRETEMVFLSDTHPGIPDVEILDKLLAPDTILLTGDRVLHQRAVERGFRSYSLNEQGQLTRRSLPGVRCAAPPHSVHRELLDDYRHRPASDLPGRLKTGLTEKQLKRYRTVRRRIRSHFGSAAAIHQASVTVGAKRTERGLLCGFSFHLAGNSGAKGLRASEGYCRPSGLLTDPACSVIHALRAQYLLQLEQVRTELFVISPTALELCHGLLTGLALPEPLHRVLRELLAGIDQLALHPCTTGRFFDAMNNKLNQLQRSGTNEVTTVDFDELTNNLLDRGNRRHFDGIHAV